MQYHNYNMQYQNQNITWVLKGLTERKHCNGQLNKRWFVTFKKISEICKIV